MYLASQVRMRTKASTLWVDTACALGAEQAEGGVGAEEASVRAREAGSRELAVLRVLLAMFADPSHDIRTAGLKACKRLLQASTRILG